MSVVGVVSLFSYIFIFVPFQFDILVSIIIHW